MIHVSYMCGMTYPDKLKCGLSVLEFLPYEDFDAPKVVAGEQK